MRARLIDIVTCGDSNRYNGQKSLARDGRRCASSENSNSQIAEFLRLHLELTPEVGMSDGNKGLRPFAD